MGIFESLMSMMAAPQTPDMVRAFEPEILKAALLLEVACHDDVFAPEERAVIVSILEKNHGVQPSEASDLLKRAKSVLDEMPDLFELTRQLNQHLNPQQKKQWMVQVWQVILADGRIDKHEDLLARKLLKLLRLDHKDWIKAKLEAREALKRSQT